MKTIRNKNPKSQTLYYQDDKFEQIKNFIKGTGILEDLDYDPKQITALCPRLMMKPRENAKTPVFPACFFSEIGLRHILGIAILHLCAKNQKKLMSQSREKLVTDARTNDQTSKKSNNQPPDFWVGHTLSKYPPTGLKVGDIVATSYKHLEFAKSKRTHKSILVMRLSALDVACFPRAARENKLRVQKTRNKYDSKTFLHNGTEVWNNLPNDLRQTQSIVTFKSKAKSHFFQ